LYVSAVIVCFAASSAHVAIAGVSTWTDCTATASVAATGANAYATCADVALFVCGAIGVLLASAAVVLWGLLLAECRLLSRWSFTWVEWDVIATAPGYQRPKEKQNTC
jgi:hypothetical protein